MNALSHKSQQNIYWQYALWLAFFAPGLIYFLYKEGRESFNKANGLECDCEDENCK